MELNQIKYFLKVIETHNFSNAATQLYVTQPTLSQQIAKLENELNVALIDRTTRFFSVTEAGKEFAIQAQTIVENIDKLKETMLKYSKDDKRIFKIGVFPTLSKTGMTSHIFLFSQEHSEIKIKLSESFSDNLYDMVESNTIDLAIVNKTMRKSKNKSNPVTSFPLICNRMVLLCNSEHELANAKSVTLEQALQYPLIKLSNHTSVTIIMNEEYRKLGIKPKVVCECGSTSNMLSLVDEGYGISFLSDTVAEHYATEKTRIIKIIPKIKNMVAIIALKKKCDNPLIREFIEHITNVTSK